MNTLFFIGLLFTSINPQIILAHSEHEKKTIGISRNSAAYVTPVKAGGHGTGTYVKIDNSFFIITAKHVTDGHQDFFINVGKMSSLAHKVYESKTKDISVLQVAQISTLQPINLDTACVLEGAGETVYFSGFPSHYSLLTTRAFITGGGERTKYLQGLAWFGSSGSGVINRKNELCGIVTAIATEQRGFFVHALESLNYMHTITDKDILDIRKVIEEKKIK